MEHTTQPSSARLLRCIAASLVAAGLVFSNAAAAQADVRILEGTWYRTLATCQSRGADLVATGQYYSPTCVYNNGVGEYPNRYSLSIWKVTAGGLVSPPD